MMFNMIPDNLTQVMEKLAWLNANGYPDKTKNDVINDMVKDGTQDMFDTALEGPYYTMRWLEEGKKLNVFGPMGDVMEVITPRPEYADFYGELENNDILFWRNLATQVQKVVGHY